MLTTLNTYIQSIQKTGRLSLKLLYFEAKNNKKNIFVSAFTPTFAIGLTLVAYQFIHKSSVMI